MEFSSQDNSDARQQKVSPPRMTPDEARAVIDLWQQEQISQGGLSNRPSVSDVAEGLDIDPIDVQRLLADVRRQPGGGDLQNATIGREHRRLARRIAWGTVIAALGAGLLQFFHLLH